MIGSDQIRLDFCAFMIWSVARRAHLNGHLTIALDVCGTTQLLGDSNLWKSLISVEPVLHPPCCKTVFTHCWKLGRFGHSLDTRLVSLSLVQTMHENPSGFLDRSRTWWSSADLTLESPSGRKVNNNCRCQRTPAFSIVTIDITFSKMRCFFTDKPLWWVLFSTIRLLLEKWHCLNWTDC